MYAGAPKIAHKLIFWSYHLRVCSSTGGNFLLLRNIDMYDYTPVSNQLCMGVL